MSDPFESKYIPTCDQMINISQKELTDLRQKVAFYKTLWETQKNRTLRLTNLCRTFKASFIKMTPPGQLGGLSALVKFITLIMNELPIMMKVANLNLRR